MNFNKHSLASVGDHAFLGGSKYHWVNYDEDKLIATYTKFQAIQRGVVLHDLACLLIRTGVKLPNTKKPINRYVNDAIGYRMTPEQVLYYSPNAFGTADAISFRNNQLRIHDLKTGVSPVSMKQLEVYAAFFCLEYDEKPEDIDIELRIYQFEDILVHNPDKSDIRQIMDKTIWFDKTIESLKKEMEE